MGKTEPNYHQEDELFSAVTHGIGIAFGISALTLLVTFSSLDNNVWKIVASTIYGISMIVLYTASTLYHSFTNPIIKKAMNLFDHISIYYLIAGTYTPFVLVTLNNTVWGWIIFGIIWTSAITGTILKIIFGNKLRKISTTLYIVMGWVIIIAIKPLINAMETGGVVLLVLGGCFYTFGVIFYKWKSLPFNHGIWHLFVLAGTITHFFAILLYVIL